ncbi:MAG: hypothetical protein ACFE9Z_17755, partial [Promethearchaeota archaeon]
KDDEPKAPIKRQFIKFVSSFARGKFEFAFNKMKSMSEHIENWLGEMRTCQVNNYLSQKFFSKKDWAFINEIFETDSDKMLSYLNNLLPTAKGDLRFILLGAHTFISHMKLNNGSCKDLFNEDSEFTNKLIDRYTNELGEICGRTLFTELCINMVWWKKSEILEENFNVDFYELKQQLWQALTKKNIHQVIALASKLKQLGRDASLFYSKLISHLQSERLELKNRSDKMKSLKTEFEYTENLRQRGLDFAIGIWFESLFKSVKKQDIKLLDEEFKQAKNLIFDASEKDMNVSIKDLVNNASDYDGKKVQVEGFITNIEEKKMRSGEEAVFTLITLESDKTPIELYYPRYWLKDNGLTEEGYAQFCGTFNEMCPQAKKPDIHLTRLSYGERKDRDWLGRCAWLVRDWWDMFTDRTPANWTFSSLTPLFDIDIHLQQDINKELLDLLKRQYPTFRASLRSFKHIIFDPVERNRAKDYRKFALYHYHRNLMIDTIIYLAITPFLTKKISANMLKIVTSPVSLPPFEIDIFQTDRKSMRLGKNLKWLEYELNYQNGGELQ